MNERTRKILCLITGAAALCAGLLMGLRLLNGYGQTVPLPVGPYKKAVFILLGLVLVFSAGFYFRPLSRQTLAGTLGITAGALWFAGRMLLMYRSPESPLIFRLDQWMPVPLMLTGAGIGSWAGALLPEKRSGLSEKWQLLLALLLMFICLQPALSGGFNWDDAFFSVEAQAMRISGESIFRRVWREIVDYVRIGRINPFATFHFLVFYFIPDAFAYKLMLVLLTILDGFLFYRFLSFWGADHRPALAALLIVPLCFQLRLYHDPLNSYYGLMQVMLCELLGSLNLFLRWLREKRPVQLVFSLLLFAMGLMSYEMFFPLTALFLLPALTSEKKLFPALRKTLPHIILAVFLFGLSMLLRRNITEATAYNGTTFALDLKAILTALSYQLRAAFPLSYRLSGYDAALFGKRIPWDAVFNISLRQWITGIRWEDLIACLILAAVVNGAPDRESGKFSWMKVLFALLLWVLPGTVISLSEKYQHDLYPGVAYIPVFFSYFGAALLLYEFCALLGKVFRPRMLRPALTGAACAVLLITLRDNREISLRLNDIFLYPRAAGEAALQAGILDENADADQLVISTVPYSLWEHGWQQEPYQAAFYSLNARRPIRAVGQRDYTARQDPETGWINPQRTAVITYGGDEQSGFAKSGRLRGTGFDFETKTLSSPSVSEVFFFVSGKAREGARLVYATTAGEWRGIPVEEAWLIRETEAGALYKLQETDTIVYDTIGIIWK